MKRKANLIPPGDPILSCAEARELEDRLFASDEGREWEAMTRAGAAIGRAVLDDFSEIGPVPAKSLRVLVVAGKGHNGGDAILAAAQILETVAGASAEVLFVFGERELRPLAAKAMRQLVHGARERVKVVAEPAPRYDVCLDGLFGFQFRPPLPAEARKVLTRIAEIPIRLRAAVDLPSGLSDATTAAPGTFRADFTYCTGSVKNPVIAEANAPLVGRIRYLDLGFFEPSSNRNYGGRPRILGSTILEPLRALRDPRADKRAHGNLFVVAGSETYPGAALLCVLAALRSGVGLVTAFVPEKLIPAFAARAPGAIWIPVSQEAIESRIARASALAIGPGIGDDGEVLERAELLARHSKVPLVLDADALRPGIVAAGLAPRILTPHAGELKRLKAKAGARQKALTVLVEKGRLTRMSVNGETDRSLYSPYGGPVLARGGSGDILTGIIGGLLAQEAVPAGSVSSELLLLVAARGVAWHGLAADLLARKRGQVAIETIDILDFMGCVLRLEGAL